MAKVEWFTGNPFVGFLACHSSASRWCASAADRPALEVHAGSGGAARSWQIYPEGTRALDHRLHAAKAGSGFIARHSGVPIVPVAVWGTEAVMPTGSHFPNRAECHMTYGNAVHAAAAHIDANQAAADYMLGKVAELLPPRYRGVYGEGGVPEDATAPAEVVKAG